MRRKALRRGEPPPAPAGLRFDWGSRSDDSTRDAHRHGLAGDPRGHPPRRRGRPGTGSPGAPHPRGAAHRDRRHRQPRHRRVGGLREPAGRRGGHPRLAAYKLVSREAKREDTVVSVGRRRRRRASGWSSSRDPAPSSAEARPSRSRAAWPRRGRDALPRRRLQAAHLALLVPGAGGGRPARSWPRVREETGLPIVTEVIDTETVELVAEYADCLQIGARNMQNFSLLKRLGRIAQAGAAEARHVGDARGVAPVRRVRPVRGQLRGDPVRAGRADVRGPHAQHARPLRDPVVQAHLPPADPRRPVARHRQAGRRCSRCRGPRPWPRAPTGC